MRVVKAHAYGNDFLYVRYADAGDADPVPLARAICHRHTGIGADGLILFDEQPDGATMRLINSDGSHSEVSGNGVRGLGALLAFERGLASGELSDPHRGRREGARAAGDRVRPPVPVQGRHGAGARHA